MLWARYFTQAQGFTIDKRVLFQDNLSTMLLELNVMNYSSKRTKHIRVRYYLIKDRIAVSDIVVNHCPTGVIPEDHFTKPLQGVLFRKFRAEIQVIHTLITDGDMVWDVPGPFNVPPEVGETTTDKPISQEFVWNDQHDDKLVTPGSIIKDQERR